ncbi:MAG: right-handed parallel beta-helix repeat-containing protein [Sedimentisphaerales bacterium]|nr:right-handed parallel beta-helix repeat-containing protein [Sedimentisphaerales bacterium]
MTAAFKKALCACLFMMAISFGVDGVAAEIWVSPDGSDRNPGTRVQPMASVLMAQRKARNLRRLNDPSVRDGVRIILRDGVYELVEPLRFRPEDSGTQAGPTLVIAAPGEHPVLSGGVTLQGWKKAAGEIPGLPQTAQGKVWVTEAPRPGGRGLEFRQMWVNGKKAARASTLGDGALPRILSVDKQKQEMWIPALPQTFKDVGALEFVIHQWWAIAILRVKSLDVEGDKARVTFWQPESRIEFEHPWPAPFIDEKKDKNGNSAFYLSNAIELLNQPGEWYEDLDASKVYYWPRPGEDLSQAKVVVPMLETLVRVEGTLDEPVAHLRFEGIRFAHTSWLRPSRAGHVPLQAGMYILDAYKLLQPGTPDKSYLENQAWIGRQPASVTVACANHIQFERCRFEHLAATGLDFVRGTHHDQVQGCTFRDIGGTGLQMGFFGDAAFEAHLPYDPSDEREVCRFERIANNLLTDCTNEDWGCVGISVGYARDVTIEHNEISHLNYSGIAIGWGWTRTISCMRNNKVVANHIHHFAKNMYDVGGIYTLSPQPHTEISGNSIHDLAKAPYAHDPTHYQYIYLDENSSYIRVLNNWTEADKFFSNTPGPGNEWKNNGPDVSEEVKNQAGLEPAYRDLLEL